LFLLWDLLQNEVAKQNQSSPITFLLHLVHLLSLSNRALDGQKSELNTFLHISDLNRKSFCLPIIATRLFYMLNETLISAPVPIR